MAEARFDQPLSVQFAYVITSLEKMALSRHYPNFPRQNHVGRVEFVETLKRSKPLERSAICQQRVRHPIMSLLRTVTRRRLITGQHQSPIVKCCNCLPPLADPACRNLHNLGSSAELCGPDAKL
ncbi:hypothetical protein J6590_036010 [Homalodisca vitripennis]|nr:hypothetical protein J6590_036010 [Homalodisca vitripennis]